MLRVRGAKKNYGEIVALQGVDLDVAEGQIVSLLGKNGAGKSTLLSVIAGLTKPDSGTVEVGGIDALRRPDDASRLIGIAPQETGIYAPLTVRENLDFFGDLAGLKRSVRKTRVDEVAQQLGLTELLSRRAISLSGGEARRLHTACALLHRPKLLMLDEATVGADVSTRVQLIKAVQDLAADGAAVIYTTHYLPEVEALGSHVVILDNGTVSASGSQAELIDTHSLVGLRVVVEGPPPQGLLDLNPVDVGGGTFRVEQSITMAELLQSVGEDAKSLISVERLRPDLETVFLAVTGSRIDDESEQSGEEQSGEEQSGETALLEGGQ